MAFGLLFLCVVLILSSSSNAHNNEQSCLWQKIPNNGDDSPITYSLQCRARTISNADSVLANLTSTEMDKITSFHLECSDVLFFESSLENSFLTQLRRLQELKLEYCKIRYVPVAVLSPSRELRYLTLRTHNRDWSAMNMMFHSESFRGLPQLKFLDLSDNNIWSLPKELFCPLHTLTHLNLSSNRLQNVFELGFSDWGDGPSAPGKTCNVGLELLDLSDNEITSLPDNGFTSLRSLQKFYLQNNVINSMADRAFVGLQSLLILNISNNRLTALPPELFQSTRNLKEVYLFNNSINVLAPGLLEGLDQLVILDMSHNELTSSWVNKDTFSGLVRLVVLNIGHNQLTKIDSHVFQDLYSLQILNLEHNRIESIADGSFSTLSNLHALKLTHNKLVTVETFHFSGLYVINQLFLDHNHIVSIDAKTFENCSNLHDLGLHGNKLSEIPEAIRELRFLKTLDLGGNRIQSVVNTSFHNLDQLNTLILSNNNIANITKNTFSTLPSLRILNLASNRIQFVDRAAFGVNSTLHAIRLDANKLNDISGMFVQLQNLVWLNISDNDILWFDYSFLPPSLEWLDMHKNRINDLGNYFEKRETLQIKMLDVSFNKLAEISDTSIPDSVESVFLNNNVIKKVKINTFLRKANLSRVVLFDNQIRTIDMAALRLDPVPEDKELPQFYISENPFVCDCTMEWLPRVNSFSSNRQYPRVMDVDSASCHVIYGRGQTVRSIMDLKPSQFLCPYESHCFAVCECCEYDACDCEMTCPTNCSCFHDHLWTSNIVDCSNAGYSSVPSRIPMDATEIYLDGNNLAELDSHVFIGKKRLQVLYLNDSNIATIHNKTFNGVNELKVLHLENNDLQSLEGFEFNELEKLSELYLESNHIKDVAESTFVPLKQLEVLHLEQNRIDSFAAVERITSDNLALVSLAGNSWSCECSNIRELISWLKDNKNVQMDDVRCSDSERSVAAALKFCAEGKDNGVDSVSNVNRDSFYSSSSVLSSDYVPFMAASLVLFIIVFLVSTLAFIFKNDIKLWLHSHYGVRILTGNSCEDDSDRLFDAYMVYSLKDDEFVNQVISASLERLGYSLCLHYRDMHVMSPAYLTDSLLGASDASKRIILVLSLSFLQNEWERPVFKAALQTCLERYGAGGRKIISIITSNNCALSPELQSILKSCHVLSWGEKRFWEKLRYLMPDIRRKHNQTDSKKITCDKGIASARYTTAPTSLDTYYKMSPAASLTQSSVPTQSSCVSEESSQRTTTDEDDDLANQHSYMTIDYPQRHNKVLHHVYSSIPDPIYNTNGRTYFV
ncbi:toll-like receptor 6 [Planococcus citri]|uniref:toll-like receptor 6 n=1 Tax=Planococcus citri TaxID=170843 RepID=UPI0031FA3B8A